MLISIPAFEAVQLGTERTTAFRDAGVQRMLVFGQYAWTNAVTFASVADGVVMDEPEALVAGLIDCASQRVSDARRIAGRPRFVPWKGGPDERARGAATGIGPHVTTKQWQPSAECAARAKAAPSPL